MRLADAVERERSPYERAWRRMMRTGVPALYFHNGRWQVANTTHARGATAAYAWIEAHA